MKYEISVEKLFDKGLWENFCEMKGINVYAVNEGLIEMEEIFILTEEQADEIGLSITIG